jgi:hypothetical protein
MKTPDQNAIQETTGSEKKESRHGFELPEATTKEIVEQLSSLDSSINHDVAITAKNVSHIDGAISRIDVGGIEKIPELKRNLIIWQEVRNGDFRRVPWISYLTNEMAKEFSTMNYGRASFPRISNISDEAIRYLVNDKGLELTLGISSISEKAAEYISKQAGSVRLNNLENLSVGVASYLAKVHGELYLNRLDTLSIGVAEQLGRHDGGLELASVTTLSDDAIKHLCQSKGFLRLYSLKMLSDDAARYIGGRKDETELTQLTTISDIGAAYLLKGESAELYQIQNHEVRKQLTSSELT